MDPLCSLETIDEVDETDEEVFHTPKKSPTSTRKEHSRNKVKSFDCKTCNKTFIGAKGLAKHEEKHTKHQSKKYTRSSKNKKSERCEDNFRCKVCDKKFSKKLSLIRHQVNHSKVNRPKKDIPLARPSEKDVMFVDTEDSIHPELASCQDDPISIDLGKSKPFLCTDCDKSHSDYNKLLIHIKKHHAVKKSLKTRSNGTKHQIRGTKEKPEFKIGDIKSIYDEIAMNCNTLLDSSFSDDEVEIVGSPKKTGKETSKAGLNTISFFRLLFVKKPSLICPPDSPHRGIILFSFVHSTNSLHPVSYSWGIFVSDMAPFKGPQPSVLLLELQKNKDTVRCAIRRSALFFF